MGEDRHSYSDATVKSKQSRFFYGYIIVLCGFLVLLVTMGIQYSFGIFFTPLLKEFGWSRAITSAAFSISQVSAGFMGILIGRLSDSYNPKWIVMGCGIFLGLSCILMSLTNSIWQLYLFLGLFLGVGVSGSFAPTLSAVSRWFINRRGLMTGIVVSGIGCGTIVFPLLVNELLSIYTWRTSFIIIGVLAMVVVITSAFFIKREPLSMGMLAYGAKEAAKVNITSKVEGVSFRQAVRTVNSG